MESEQGPQPSLPPSVPPNLLGRGLHRESGFQRFVSNFHEFFRRRFGAGEQGILIILAVIVGIAMGLVSSLFRYLIDISHHYLFEATHRESFFFLDLSEDATRSMVTMLLPAMGGLIVGLLIYRVLKITGGHGVPSVMKAVATGKTNLSPHMATKSTSSVITITSGGSVGPEGPIIEIGSVVGSVIGRHMQLSKERVGTLIGCGAAAGIAAFFNAPFGGVFLAIELLLRDFAVRTFGPIMIAAVMAHVTSEAVLPHSSSIFPVMEDLVMQTIQPTGWQIIMFALQGVLCGLFGVLMIVTLYKTHDFFHPLKIPMWIKPAIGGLGVGMVGLAFPDVIGEGYGYVNKQILEHFAAIELTGTVAITFLLVALVKIFVTSLTLGSGGTGGSFAPAMVMGAMVGAGWGVFCNWLFPSISASVPVFALVGMAGCACSALGTPIAGILIIYEISGGDYRLLVPLMICVATSALVAHSMNQGSVYTLSLLRDGFDVEEAIRRVQDPLTKIPVREIMKQDFTRLAPNDNLAAVVDTFTVTEDDAFVVVEPDDTLIGIISASDLRGVLNMGDLGSAIIAADAADSNPQVLYPDSPASEALTVFGSTEATAIPVMEQRGSRKIVGLVGRIDILSTYRKTAGTQVEGGEVRG